jgi:hypothetical protein
MTSSTRVSEVRVPNDPDPPHAAPPHGSAGKQSERYRIGGPLLLALAIGTAIRAWHTWSANFPLNDGGLFYMMVRDLQRAHYHLPDFTSYNGGHIPFAYSPFTFYLTGLLNDATGLSLLDALRVLPFLASTASIGAFALLARAWLPTGPTTAGALVAFAIVPRGFVWLIMGGGLTRSFGYLFALLALCWIWLLYTRRSLRYVPLASICCALTASSHLGTAPFVAFSAVLFLLYRGRHRQGVIGSLLIGAGALLLTAPWWGSVIATHGLAPFIAARASGGSLFSAGAQHHASLRALWHAVLGATGEGMFPLILALALLGGIWCILYRRTLLPVWWVCILVFDPRAGATYASAPVAMLAGIAVVELLWPLVAKLGRQPRQHVYQRVALLAFALLLCGSILSAVSTRPGIAGETRVLTTLAPADRAAMRWVSLHTDAADRVLVLTSVPWEIDKVSEWFPALAERVSVATVQGTEWLPHGEFERAIRRQRRLTACADAEASCLDSLLMDPTLRFTEVYVPNGTTVRCCRPLLASLLGNPRYQVVYDGEGATIFALH